MCVFVGVQMEALPQLTVRQLAEVSATPGQLTSPDHVYMVMKYVPDQFLSSFYDDFSPAIMVSTHHTFILPANTSSEITCCVKLVLRNTVFFLNQVKEKVSTHLINIC